MELHQLRYVMAVSRTGNFSRAAAQCHVSQPSLSQQIQKLEQDLGERLFTRLKREAVPTAAGRALILRAARILQDVEAAQREVADSGDKVQGVVNLGVIPTIAPHLLPEVITRFHRAYPAVEIIVQERTTTQLLSLAAACELDLAILSLPVIDERFVVEELFIEDLLLAVPPGHRLAGRRQVRLQEVESERFILLQEGHCLGDQALRFCDRHQCHPPVVFRTAQLETIQSLVASGVGISLMPRMACQRDRLHQPVYVVLADPCPQRAIAVLWRKEHHHNRAAAALLEVLRQVARDMKSAPRVGRKKVAEG
ncbi:MAG: LysR family transcriptional regulator [Prosthecobacter sp.]